LFDKIELVLDPQIEQMYNQTREMDLRMHSAVEITTANGQSYNSGIVERGADRFDQAALERKFRRLTGFVLDSARVEKTLEMAGQVERLDNVRELTQFLG
jgi:2-methylcitrate dehydratase PrpD